MTSFSTSICGSHGSSGNGDRIMRPRVLPAGGLAGTRSLGVLRGLLAAAPL